MTPAAKHLGQMELMLPKYRLATELAAMTLLHEISTRFVQEGNTKSLFEQIVNVALEITSADMGNIQVLDETTGRLKIVACCSSQMQLPDCCKQLDKREAACGIALTRAKRVVIDDVAQSPELAGSASLNALLSVGVRSVQSTPLFTRSGRLVGLLSTHSRIARRLEDSEMRLLDMLARQIADILEHSQATEALRKSTERYRCLFDNLLDGYSHCRIILEDGVPGDDFEFLAINPAFIKLTGLKDVVGKKVSEVIPGIRRDNPELLQVFGQVALTGEPARFETFMSGLAAWFSIAVYRPAEGEFVAVFDNITERKRLEKELQGRRGEMENLLKHQVAAQTAAAIAHDLNQPLIAISAYSEVALRLIRKGATHSEKLAHVLEGGFQQAQRAGRTLHELLDFLHNGETVSTPMDINEVIREAITMGESGYGEFEAVLELDKNLPLVVGNRVQVQKVLDNLLHNAIDAMLEAGARDKQMNIRVKTSAKCGAALVAISDSGRGLDAETASRVFEPFFTTKQKGIGLGLAISRTLIEAHGGRLWAEPGSETGATFQFTLPFAA